MTGLPLHPLVVHAAVVLLPLAAVGLVAIIAVPRWRGALGWLVMGGLVVATGATFVAKESGEALAARVGNPRVHAQLGDQLPLMAGALLAVGMTWFLLSRRDERAGATSRATTVLGVISILVAVLNLVWVVRVGHSGAEATWGQEVEATNTSATSGAGESYTLAQVKAHNSPADCWTAIGGTVYDVTDYWDAHPGGVTHIDNLCGTDGTSYYNGQHRGETKPNTILAGYAIGTLTAVASPSASPRPSESISTGVYTMRQVAAHDTVGDCWAVVRGTVYDVSGYSTSHPGGVSHIESMCGTDATSYFGSEHEGDKRATSILDGFQVGTLG